MSLVLFFLFFFHYPQERMRRAYEEILLVNIYQVLCVLMTNVISSKVHYIRHCIAGHCSVPSLCLTDPLSK